MNIKSDKQSDRPKRSTASLELRREWRRLLTTAKAKPLVPAELYRLSASLPDSSEHDGHLVIRQFNSDDVIWIGPLHLSTRLGRAVVVRDLLRLKPDREAFIIPNALPSTCCTLGMRTAVTRRFVALIAAEQPVAVQAALLVLLQEHLPLVAIVAAGLSHLEGWYRWQPEWDETAVRDRLQERLAGLGFGDKCLNPLRPVHLPGDQFHLRFLRFGEDQRFISTIAHHQIHRNDPEVCPRITDPTLGGDPGTECALCVSMGLFPCSLRPRIVTRYWAYAVVLAGTFPERHRRRFITRDADEIGRPHRLRLSAGEAIQLKAFAKQDPEIFNWDCGRDLVLLVSRNNQQVLRALRRGPLQLTQNPQGQERQRLSIESFLGKPHLYNPPERVMDPEERHWKLIQAEVYSSALSRFDGIPSHADLTAGPRAVAKRQRRLDSLTREVLRDQRNLHQLGWDEDSPTNPQPARDRSGQLYHRFQTVLQYRDAMRRSSKAFWSQFHPH